MITISRIYEDYPARFFHIEKNSVPIARMNACFHTDSLQSICETNLRDCMTATQKAIKHCYQNLNQAEVASLGCDIHALKSAIELYHDVMNEA